MSTAIKLLKDPTDAMIDEAVDVLQRAFAGDLTLPPMTGGNLSLVPLMFRAMIRAAVLEGSVYVITGKFDQILSLSAWFGPGKKILDTEAQRALGWNDFFAALSPETQKWWSTTLYEHNEKLLDKLLGANYADSWFGDIIATDPAHQRKGYGTALVKTVIARAEKEGKLVALTTQNKENAAWYNSLGFQLIETGPIPAPNFESWTIHVLTLGKAQ